MSYFLILKQKSFIQSTQRVFCAVTADKFYLERTIAGDSKQKSAKSARQTAGGAVAVVRGGILSYGCIYKTHSFPIMLLSILFCVFSMILKYRTLYSKYKMFGFWLPNQNYWYLVTRTSGSPPCLSPVDHRDSTRSLRIAQMSGQFSWWRCWADCPLNVATENGCRYNW